jgi:hypothetical protein
LGTFARCFKCGNHQEARRAWHNPRETPGCGDPTDRLATIYGPVLEAFRLGKEPPLRTVSSLRAGLPPLDRTRTEKAFRRGKLSVLISTSLMELGIDIGRLDTLLQHGVPPTFTNYIQRSGRVGRSLGRPACVYNVLRPENPIDMYYFADLESRFFRDLPPIYIPVSSDTRAVCASQAMGRLLDLLNIDPHSRKQHRVHWGAPSRGRVPDVRRARRYLQDETEKSRPELTRVLGVFGLGIAEAENVLKTLLDMGLPDDGNPTPGSHRARIEAFLERLTVTGRGAHEVDQMVRAAPNYPVLLSTVGLFARYRNIGEEYQVAMRTRRNGREQVSYSESRTPDQLLRECFPGPANGQPGGFFYQGLIAWRIDSMLGEETRDSQEVRYCSTERCNYVGQPFLRLDRCPGCDQALEVVHTARPVYCESERQIGFQKPDPRVFAYVSSIIPVGALPVDWAACGNLGDFVFLPVAKVVHTVPIFYDGQKQKNVSSRVHVPNPQLWNGDFCAGITEVFAVLFQQTGLQRVKLKIAEAVEIFHRQRRHGDRPTVGRGDVGFLRRTVLFEPIDRLQGVQCFGEQ